MPRTPCPCPSACPPATTIPTTAKPRGNDGEIRFPAGKQSGDVESSAHGKTYVKDGGSYHVRVLSAGPPMSIGPAPEGTDRSRPVLHLTDAHGTSQDGDLTLGDYGAVYHPLLSSLLRLCHGWYVAFTAPISDLKIANRATAEATDLRIAHTSFDSRRVSPHLRQYPQGGDVA